MNGSQITDVNLPSGGTTLTLTFSGTHLSFSPDEYQVFLARLIAIGTEASKQRTNLTPVDINQRSPSIFFPSELTQAGLVETDSKKLVLLVRLFDLDLSFEVTRPRLRALALHLSQAVEALDADESKPH